MGGFAVQVGHAYLNYICAISLRQAVRKGLKRQMYTRHAQVTSAVSFSKVRRVGNWARSLGTFNLERPFEVKKNPVALGLHCSALRIHGTRQKYLGFA